MAVDTSTGFEYMGRFGNTHAEQPITLLFKDTETLTRGDLLNLEVGEVDLAVTGDTALLGAALLTRSGTDSTTEMQVIPYADAVYSVYDANARVFGELLDVSGATGAMGVAAPVNNDLIVVGGFLATERTLVMINHGKHAFN